MENIFEYKDMKIFVKDRISYKILEGIIEAIVDACFVDGKYMPYRKDFFIWYMILKYFTDIDIDNIDPDSVYKMIDDYRFTDGITGIISQRQYYRICDSVDELIDVRLNESPIKQTIVKVNELIEAVKNVIDSLGDENTIKDIIDSIGGKEGVENILSSLNK